jgi:hypothetical protein
VPAHLFSLTPSPAAKLPNIALAITLTSVRFAVKERLVQKHRNGYEMVPRLVITYLIGLVSAPLVAKVVQPIARSAVKTTIELGLQARKLAIDAAEDLQDLVAETTAEMAAAEMEKKPGIYVARSRNR